MEKWIDAGKELPKEAEKVLCSGQKGGLYIGELFYRSGKPEWYTLGKPYAKPVAWMPLPEPYKKVKG